MSNKRINSIRVFSLQVFVTVAEAGSYVQAAQKLGCDPSTVSREMTNLESWTHKLLFTLDTPRELTPEGHRLLPIAEDIVQQLETFRKLPEESQ